MNYANLSLLIIIILVSVYGALSIIEFGVALTRLRKPTAKPPAALRFFTPLFEITNVFLVFGFTGFAVLFNNALPKVSELVFSSVIVGVVALVIRSCLILEIFYRKPKLGPNLSNIAFALVSAMAPLGLTMAGVILLTGKPAWQSAAGVCLVVLVLGLLISGGLSFSAFVAKNDDEYHAAGESAGFAVNSIGLFTLMPILTSQLPQLQRLPLGLLALSFFVGCVVHLASMWHRHPKWSWYHTISLCFAIPLMLAAANLPYLLYGQLTVSQSYGAEGYGAAAFVGLAVMAPIMLFGLWLFARLLTEEK